MVMKNNKTTKCGGSVIVGVRHNKPSDGVLSPASH